MSVSIVLKKNKSPKNKIIKTFDSTTADVTGVLKENCSILRPRIIIKSSSSIYNFDYMVISTFGRSYFIDDIISIGNDMWEIRAHVDVLETYATAIKANSAVIRRQENKYNLYLDDPEFKTYNYERLQTLKFPTNNFVKNLSYILTINGDAVSNAKEEVIEDELHA